MTVEDKCELICVSDKVSCATDVPVVESGSLLVDTVDVRDTL